MKILGIIPARGGSKGVPRKNIKLLRNKPLLQYTAEVALSSVNLEKVILSSDDEEIISVAKSLGIEVPFKRPSELGLDSTPTLPVVLHALEFFRGHNTHFDAVCLLQTTHPFRTTEFLDKAITIFTKGNTDSLISVQEVPHEYNPHWVFEENDKGGLKIATGENVIISRRQDLPKAYHRDGSLYLTRTSVLTDKKSLYGDSMAYIVSPEGSYVNIDTMGDWNKAENIAKAFKV